MWQWQLQEKVNRIKKIWWLVGVLLVAMEVVNEAEKMILKFKIKYVMGSNFELESEGHY